MVNELDLDNPCLLDLRKALVVAGIPAFNEEKSIAAVILSAQKHADIVVVCDDGSSDKTLQISEVLGADVIRHEQNLGYGAALQSLIKRALDLEADVLVTLDSDGQHNPDEIPLLVKPIEDGKADVVLGSRFLDNNGTVDMPLYRKVGIKVITKLANGSAKIRISDSQSGFRAYSRNALKQLTLSDNGMSASLQVLRAVDRNRLKIYEVPISCKYEGLAVDSSVNPIAHGMSLLISIIKASCQR